MSDPNLGTYSFLPWVRQGSASNITTADTLTAGQAGRVTLPVVLRINGADLSVTLRLNNPGDLTSMDPRQTVRTDPRPFTADFEPNYFPAIEFDRPDMPWMFTPAKANSNHRLRPWICLVAVRRQEGVTLRTDPSLPAPVLEIKAPAVPNDELPNLAESWAWAHAQVSGSLSAGPPLKDVNASAPQKTLSRLMCPCNLEPNAQYFACVVPAFELGRKAGLGEQITAADETELRPAWTSGPGAPATAVLPVYFHWEFSTGRAGDFETLARLLQARPSPAHVGFRDMYVGNAGFGLPLIPRSDLNSILKLEGALRAPQTEPQPWPDPPRGPFETTLRKILDAPETQIAAASDPIVGPPIYARWHAAQKVVPPTGAPPHWVRELNLDPRHRTAAGFGTIVIQNQQEPLMEAAWKQIGEVLRANRSLRYAQVSRATQAVYHLKYLTLMSSSALLSITSPAQARFLMSPVTLRQQIRDSALQANSVSPAFRRIARARGPLMRRILPDAQREFRPIVARLDAREIEPAPSRALPAGAVTIDKVTSQVGGPLEPIQIAPFFQRLRIQLTQLAANHPAVAEEARAINLEMQAAIRRVEQQLALPEQPQLDAIFHRLRIMLLQLAEKRPEVGEQARAMALELRNAIRRLEEQLEKRVREPRGDVVRPDKIAGLPGRPDFQIPDVDVIAQPPASSGPGDSAEAAIFRAAAVAHEAALLEFDKVPDPPPRAPLAVTAIRPVVLDRLDPQLTIPARVFGRIKVPPRLWAPEDPIEPIMAHPIFPTPMYEELKKLSPSHLLPGVDLIEPNTITLLETNPRFIEAFMVGLNHEMSRELLWREYPTDQRGSYFRQFWDVSGRIPPPGNETERDAARDIKPIHAWRKAFALGENLVGPGVESKLVLLIRGELLRRYPNTIIYAAKAGRPDGPGTRRKPGAPEKYELFRGTLPPDITFIGFPLTEEEALGTPGPDGDPGWFFILQEHATEPRFGLDEAESFGGTPSSWDTLSWGHLVESEEGFRQLRHISIANVRPAVAAISNPPNVRWGANSAAMAYITLQKPFRVAIHASAMISRSTS
ncbi:MAG: hypothetical protein ACKVX9_14680 [Blastocatellia bacterium]